MFDFKMPKNYTFSETVEEILKLARQVPGLEIWVSEPLEEKHFKQPGANFTIDIFYPEVEDEKNLRERKSVCYKIRSLFRYMLLDWYGVWAVDLENYCDRLFIHIIGYKLNKQPKPSEDNTFKQYSNGEWHEYKGDWKLEHPDPDDEFWS